MSTAPIDIALHPFFNHDGVTPDPPGKREKWAEHVLTFDLIAGDFGGGPEFVDESEDLFDPWAELERRRVMV